MAKQSLRLYRVALVGAGSVQNNHCASMGIYSRTFDLSRWSRWHERQWVQLVGRREPDRAQGKFTIESRKGASPSW